MNGKGWNQLHDFIENYWPVDYKGFFIEAGANDGLNQNNTEWLEHRGWYGLLEEPHEVEFGKCFINRTGCRVERCALVSHDYKKPTIGGYFSHKAEQPTLIAQVSDPTLKWEGTRPAGWRGPNAPSTIIQVPARTLDNILVEMFDDPSDPYGREYNQIDFFSLDVEGYEFEALKGLDLNKNGPTLICVEIHPNSGLFIDIMNWLTVRHNYEMVLQLGGEIDFLFKRKER